MAVQEALDDTTLLSRHGWRGGTGYLEHNPAIKVGGPVTAVQLDLLLQRLEVMAPAEWLATQPQ